MASKCCYFFIITCILTLNEVCHISAFPTPARSDDDKAVYNRQLTQERPIQEQIAEADNVKAAIQSAEIKTPTTPKDTESGQDNDDLTVLKSLAEGQKFKDTNETPVKTSQTVEHIPDESDSTKSRRLVEDYDSTKSRLDYGKYQDDPESFHQVDGTPLTAEDIVQKIANRIYEEDDRGVFDRIVSKLLKLGLITDSQADTLEYQVAEALQDLITKNAKNNEEGEDMEEDYTATREQQGIQSPDTNTDATETLHRRYDDEEDEEEVEGDTEEGVNEVDRDVEEDHTWDREDGQGNEVRPMDGLQDLQYFPNFYRLLRSLDSEQDAQERETLVTIMKTLIDFVKMMVKYGTITPQEGVSYLENLDAMIAMQTKKKLGQSLLPDVTGPSGKSLDEEDNTKAEAAKILKEQDDLKDSTKEESPATETNQPGKSETYLEAIRKNIEWLKKHNKEDGKADYDLPKIKEFMDQQVDEYIEKGILAKDEGDTIKRIYSSL